MIADTLPPAMIGLAMGIAALWLAGVFGMTRERSLFPTALIAIASNYILFAFENGDRATLVFNVLVACAFVIVALFGFQKSLWLVVIGLAAHGLFDVAYSVAGRSPAPDWWAAFCLVFDLVFAAWLAWLLYQGKLAKAPDS